MLLAAFAGETRLHSLWPRGGGTRFDTQSHRLYSTIKHLALSAISGHERLYISHAGVLMGGLPMPGSCCGLLAYLCPPPSPSSGTRIPKKLSIPHGIPGWSYHQLPPTALFLGSKDLSRGVSSKVLERTTNLEITCQPRCQTIENDTTNIY